MAMSDADLLDASIDANYKCAQLYTQNDGSLAMDWKGFCYLNWCYPCDPGPSFASAVAVQNPSPCPAAFNGHYRVCVAPGYYAISDGLVWNPLVFINDTAGVWLAIIFSLLCVFMGLWVFVNLLKK